MLEKLRGSVGSVFIKALLGLLILSFMAWGVGDILNPSTVGQEAAKVGPYKISQQELAIAYNRQASFLRQRGISTEMISQLGLTEQVVNDLVKRSLFDAESDKLEIGISDATIINAIHRQKSFQNSLGEFDRSRFEIALQQIGYNETYYINALKREIATSQLLNSLTTGISASNSMAIDLYNWKQESRDANFIIYPINDKISVTQPNDSDISSYYDINKEKFRVNEMRNITYTLLSPKILAKTIIISEADIKAQYEERISDFSTVERRHIQQILLPNLKTAQNAFTMLKNGNDFIEVALDIAKADKDTIDLGFLSKDVIIDKKLAETAFSLPLNQISNPTEGMFGWFIMRNIDIKKADITAYEKVKAAIKNNIAIEHATDRVFEISNELDDALAGGMTIEEAAIETGLTSNSIKNIDSNGMINGKIIAKDVPQDNKFMQVAFETDNNSDSIVEELSDGSFFALRVDNIQPSHIRILDAVKQDIINILIAERKKIATEALVKQTVEKINAGNDIKMVAAGLDYKINHVGNIKRDSNGIDLNQLPTTALTKLFDIKIGKTGYINVGNDFIIINVISKKSANANNDTDGFNIIKNQMKAAISNDIMTQFNEALKNRHEISINRFVINDFEQRLQQ